MVDFSHIVSQARELEEAYGSEALENFMTGVTATLASFTDTGDFDTAMEMRETCAFWSDPIFGRITP